MNFDFRMKPDQIFHREEGCEIISIYELLLTREEFLATYDRNRTELFSTVRKVFYAYFYPFGIVEVFGDDIIEHIHNIFVEKLDAKSFLLRVNESQIVSEQNDGRIRKSITSDAVFINDHGENILDLL